MNKTILDAELARLSAEARGFASDLRAWVRNGLNRVTGAERRALAERFAAWAGQGQGADPDRAELREWIDQLDSEGREALTEQLSDFCETFEIKLAWLVDGELAQWPELERNLEKMALRYCLACKAAVDSDADLQKFRHRRVWKRKIKASAHAGRAGASETPR